MCSRGPLPGSGYTYDDDDTADEGGLSPPPSSSVSSVNPDELGDEIVVGTGNQISATNGDKSSPLRVTSDKEDVDMADAHDGTPASHYPKRKRASVYENLGEDKLEGGLLVGADDPSMGNRVSKQAKSAPTSMKGVLLGYWRDSPVPNDAKKHAVIGFPDVRDRLRTRIQPQTRSGETINARLFPIPPGPGGSWTTFDRTVFDDHLVGLDHNEIKEYIRIRLETGINEETEEERLKAELAAIEEAKRRLKANPPPETPQPPAVAYGKFLPENPQHGHRGDTKRRRTGSTTASFNVVTSTPTPAPAAAPTPAPVPAPASVPTPIPAMVSSQASTPTPKPEAQQQPPPAPSAPIPVIAPQQDVLPEVQHHHHILHQLPSQAQGPLTPASVPVTVPTPPQQPQPLPQHILQQHHIPIQQQPMPLQGPPMHQHMRPDDAQYIGNLPGQRPTRILVGCWSRSSAKKDADKHAVYGILGANDMFRVKLVRETMDGRFVDGNFPTGAGALWIAYEEVNFLPHIRDLNRTEMKEYVRVRQYQIDSGEAEEERVANETKAVYEAQRRAALNPKAPTGPPVHTGRHSLNAYPEEMASPSIKPDLSMQDMRDPRRGVLQDIRGRPVQEVDYRQTGRAASIDPLERTNSLARREVHKMEAAQMRQERGHGQRSMSSAPMPTPPPGIVPSDNRLMFQDNIKRLNGVWSSRETRLQEHQQQQQQQQQHQHQHQQQQVQAAQAAQAAQMMQMPPQQPPPQPQQQQQQQQPPPLPSQQMIPGPNMDEVRVLGNITYTRKQNGPFAGKLVSRGEILTIDGEDYVEYRVLTKPTFF
ncbi:hypothetical protein BKA67DRAFT_531852 [Truncatella angustata]|uniref:Uncharacterized protein n=1 Tax=Truncatella angustata TaxID=152316 RepID=A0A9P8UQR6_9PEZI|nr:uncharacterized protein BKA67DRAFT_531852 [Truncatella angustata]KAH6656591.1 hypothetical protein BKA67DRAFT_531852 [Truncatella angustata]KAH8201521.1 hypothetical protein TruAng_004292 [Truncatella angustata]